ncbi:MAG: hypothetical protein FRX49_03304 [Trebouxia sp. A1-2]|nr:MAG: hypothetical protein FRX49_03304 [Trebouxia sp. A1-2]
MTEGSLLSWMKQSGDQVEPYDLLFELETESLTEEAYRIECVEDAFLAKQLVPPSSKSLPVGTPIGLLCEDEEDIQEVAQHQLPDDLNEYNKGDQKSYRFATWQSYLKERKEKQQKHAFEGVRHSHFRSSAQTFSAQGVLQGGQGADS